MDDILSAALGQSGLNRSFLEIEDRSNNANLELNANGILQSNQISDEGEDLTDFLKMFVDPLNDKNTNSCLPKPSNEKQSDDDFLNSLLNCGFEEEAVPSPDPSTHFPVNMFHSAENQKRTNLTSLFPEMNCKKSQKTFFRTNTFSGNCSQQPSNSSFVLKQPFYDVNGPAEIEKRRQSIQKVLASPNLTAREKQFLMKSALSHKMKPDLIDFNSTTKGLSSMLKQVPNLPMSSSQDYDYEEEYETELAHADTFAEYMPSKVKVGYLHPDPVVETSSMASVPPPDVWYNLLLPQDVIVERKLSALQLESVVYASQQHEQLLANGRRAGFLIGDGAGVGKGRTVAGIIYENYLHGRKRSIWLSVSNDLRFDAIRDLTDIGCHAKVLPLNKFKYDEKITAKTNGKFKKGCIFSTYSALIGETSGNSRFKSRLEQLLHWCGDDFDGPIILDECHKAKNLMPVGSSKPTKTGINVMKLQDLLPKARVVYCSATGASEPKNMAYMNRLGLWGTGTAFKEFSDFIQSVEKRGVGAMEMVAMDMKLRGMYIARQLSFSGVTFNIQEVKLCSSFIEMYDASVKLWLDARTKFENAADIIGLDSKGKKIMWGQYWSAHQRFFKYLCIAAKVKTAVEIAKNALSTGKCVLFGLQSTGEARTLDQLDDMFGELNDFISTTKGVFSTLVEKHFPTTDQVDSMAHSSNRKRKNDWRKSTKQKHRKFNQDSVGFMTSSGTESSSNGDSAKEDALTESEIESDVERDPFAESSSSDDDSWMREKKPKNVKKESKIGKLKISRSIDPSINALAAAGLNIGRQYSWTSTTSNADVTRNMKSSRTTKTSIPQGLSQQLNSMKRSMSKMNPVEHCKQMKQNLLNQLDVISPYLPPNTLDELIDELGGSDHVAEMTGRKGRVVAKADGSFVYEPRTKDDVPLELLNVAEKKRFMDGEKLIAVISEAASSGISLQADRREKNQRRRVHITLELPWSADKAIQQFGRSHRSNQVSAPEYLFLISELAGEQRFASIVAKRLESLGALTHGDRRATESRDLSRYNFDTKYGRQALDNVLKSVVGLEKPMVSTPACYKGNFFEDVRTGLVGIGLLQRDSKTSVANMADKDYTNISRFLNRILGLTVSLQNSLFQYFTDTLAAIIKEAKRSGRWDEGIVDLGSQGESVVENDVKTFLCPSTCGHVTTELHTLSIERGMSFSKALSMEQKCTNPHEGFYLSSQLRNGKNTAVLVLKPHGKSLYSIYRPNIGLVQKLETFDEIQSKYRKVSADDAEGPWNDQYEYSENNCSHAFWRGYCKRKIVGLPCEVGTRKRTCYLLCGSVLSVWSKVETLLSCQPGPSSKMQVIRLKLDNGTKLVGMCIPSNCVEALVNVLQSDKNIEQRS